MKFLRRTVWKTRRDRVQNERLRQELGIASVKEVLETGQLKWSSHVITLEEHKDSLKTMEYIPDDKRPRGRPRMSYLEYVDRLCRARGRDLRQASNPAANRECWRLWLNASLR
ncbi:uncharacterized protein [Halyomorpha halys]|uniref:uncharacterized protein n=1 Tax=Halyomorpha halys TaxID=286706 RepID=UPI0006D4DF8F|nr:uncharacterized protein LOC106691873 [Halyomorpha halys]